MKVLPGVLSDNDEQWCNLQLTKGQSAESLLKELTDVGWPSNTAKKALRLPYEEDKIDYGNMPCPEPDLTGNPRLIDVGDRHVKVLAQMKHPRIVLFDDFLSSYECDYLIHQAKERGMERSRTIKLDDDGENIDSGRTSEGYFFGFNENEIIFQIERRISRLLNWPEDTGESLHILHYEVGQEYKGHDDYFYKNTKSYKRLTSNGGNRLSTLIMYLNDPEQGGGTCFEDIDFTVMPHKGAALFFSYREQDESSRTKHAGMPVISGHKWIMTKWFRESTMER